PTTTRSRSRSASSWSSAYRSARASSCACNGTETGDGRRADEMGEEAPAVPWSGDARIRHRDAGRVARSHHVRLPDAVRIAPRPAPDLFHGVAAGSVMEAPMNTAERRGPVRSRRGPRGQMLVMFLVFLIPMTLAVLSVYNVGMFVGEKMKLQNAADNAAY